MKINIGLASFVVLVALVCSVFSAFLGGSMIQHGDLRDGGACVAISILCLAAAWEFSRTGYSPRPISSEFTSLVKHRMKLFKELENLQIQTSFLHIELKQVQACIRDEVDISEPESLEAEEKLLQQRILANQKRLEILYQEYMITSRRLEEGPI